MPTKPPANQAPDLIATIAAALPALASAIWCGAMGHREAVDRLCIRLHVTDTAGRDAIGHRLLDEVTMRPLRPAPAAGGSGRD